MKKLDFYKLWQIMNILSEKEQELSEKDIYISLLGNSSNYCSPGFEGFLNYYSFRICDDEIIVFNDDSVAYETFTNDDFSEIPSVFLSFSEEELNSWMEDEINSQLKEQEASKIAEKETLKQQIELLTKKLNDYA